MVGQIKGVLVIKSGKDLQFVKFVQGTSGCGKSTFGTSLAQSLSIPFIDGDDLHPKSNVDKMSRGEALTDDDRLPWLQIIRQKAIQITTHPEHSSTTLRELSSRDEPVKEERKVREMAEVLETSKQETSTDYLNEPSSSRGDTQADDKTEVESKKSSIARACVIACSALKRQYRDLLRGNPSNDLHVIHIYLQTHPSELRRRMHERRNHFMKESMLQSQLASLEEPIGEKDTITIQEGTIQDQVNKAELELKKLLQ